MAAAAAAADALVAAKEREAASTAFTATVTETETVAKTENTVANAANVAATDLDTAAITANTGGKIAETAATGLTGVSGVLEKMGVLGIAAGRALFALGPIAIGLAGLGIFGELNKSAGLGEQGAQQALDAAQAQARLSQKKAAGTVTAQDYTSVANLYQQSIDTSKASVEAPPNTMN